MLDNISVFHSSIRISGSKIIYFDPFKIEDELHDADIIFITHDHFDHFSPEDIDKVYKDGTIIVVPESMEKNKDLGKYMIKVFVNPEDKNSIDDVTFKAIPAYNHLKPFHPRSNNWVGYVVTLDETVYYVAGDTDITEEAKAVHCDIALLPCGGKYTMDYKEAAELANIITPTYAVPTHYGSVAGSSEDGKKFIDLLNADIQGVIKIK